jgi:hypothetical protein
MRPCLALLILAVLALCPLACSSRSDEPVKLKRSFFEKKEVPKPSGK